MNITFAAPESQASPRGAGFARKSPAPGASLLGLFQSSIATGHSDSRPLGSAANRICGWATRVKLLPARGFLDRHDQWFRSQALQGHAKALTSERVRFIPADHRWHRLHNILLGVQH